jgi:hypothetical protein
MAFSRNAARMGWLLIGPLALQPALLAAALDAPAKGLNRAAATLLAQAPGPADAANPRRCRGRRKAPSPLTRGESQRQPCGCNGRCWRGRKRIDRPWMYFGRGHSSTWGLSSTQLGSSRRHWHQPRKRFGSCGSWRAASLKHGGFWR